MKNKTYTMFSGICLMTALMMSHSTDVQANTGYAGGDGTKENPYLISTPEQLNQLQLDVNVNGLDTTGIYYQLTNDIDLSNFDSDSNPANGNWTPIGKYEQKTNTSYVFSGNFNGNGYEIRNIKINLPTTNKVGLFGYVVNTSVIQQLDVVSSEIKGASEVGMIIGNVAGTGFKLDDVYVEGKVEGQQAVGGAVGTIQSATFYDFEANVDVTGTSSVGGLIGSSINSKLTKAYATGNVKGTEYVGGLVGSTITTIIDDTYATGNVEGDSYVGGAIGSLRADSKISNGYAAGNIKGTTTHTGGLIGFIEWNASYAIDTYATGDVEGKSYVGGLVGEVKVGGISSSYATGKVKGTSEVGGLSGGIQSRAEIKDSYATGDVYGSGKNVSGLVGYVYAGSIMDSYAKNTVVGDDDCVGGLVGGSQADSSLTGSSFEGTVKGINYVGGLAGDGDNLEMNNNHAKINVIGQGDYVGGLSGRQQYKGITNSVAEGTVYGKGYVGGLVGKGTSGAKISASNSHVTVVGQTDYVGGIGGHLEMSMSLVNSYATGSVASEGNYVGGLVGYVAGGTHINGSYATGNVTSKGNHVGGAVGKAAVNLENIYATGNVTGNNYVAGLVGSLVVDEPYYKDYTIKSSYSIGQVTANGLNAGGLVGYSQLGEKVIIDSYWDQENSKMETSAGGVGLTSKQMKFGHAPSHMSALDFTTNWKTTNGYPKLNWQQDDFINQAPQIVAKNTVILLGSEFKLSDIAYVIDDCEDDIELEIIHEDVNTQIEGVYTVELKATDSFGLEATKTLRITVMKNNAPVIHAKDLVLMVGDVFVALDHATVTDDHDTDLVIEVIKDNVDTTQVGVYQVIYRAIDSFGAETIKEIKVTVKEKVVVEESKPEVKPEEEITEPIAPQPEPEKEEQTEKRPETGFYSIGLLGLGMGLVAIGIQSSKKIRFKK